MNKIGLKLSFLLSILILLFFAACNSSTPQVANPSSNAKVLSVTIQKNDSSPNASLAFFTVNDENKLIYNVDSLPFGTKIDSLHMSIQFASSTGFIINDTVSETPAYNYGYGTGNTGSTLNAVDFTKPVKIKNLATDGKATEEYTLDLRVHKVETYLHTWTQLNEKVATYSSENQKALLMDKKFYYFQGYATYNELYTSLNAKDWNKTDDTNGLPLGVSLRDMQTYNGHLIVLHNGNEVYQSADGISWVKNDIDGNSEYDYKALLFTFKDKLWAVAQHKTSQKVKIANSLDGITWEFSELREFSNFPVSDFSATSFKPTIGREKVIVVGGLDAAGNRLSTLWSAENRMGVDTLYWVNLKHNTFEFPEISNASTAYYGSKMLILGGEKSHTEVADTLYQLSQSIDEGLTWIKPDTLQNRLPENYAFRSNASVIHDKDDYSLYVIGGKDKQMNALSDVWKIKVNFYSFQDFLDNPTKY